jgi:hypothetical protein
MKTSFLNGCTSYGVDGTSYIAVTVNEDQRLLWVLTRLFVTMNFQLLFCFFNGVAPWTVTYTNGTAPTTVTGINANPTFSVFPIFKPMLLILLQA